MKIVLAVLLFLGLAGCADSHSGFYCPSSFSSDDCRARLVSSSCLDGGVSSQGTADGGERLCCNWDRCTSNPYPDAQ